MTLTIDTLLNAKRRMDGIMRGSLFDGGPQTFGGMRVLVVDAQRQMRTPRDVPGEWARPRVPPKRKGRRGTRKAWSRKRHNWPHRVFYFREPTDSLRFGDSIILTEAQFRALKRAAQ